MKVKSGINKIVTIIVTVVLSFGLTGIVLIKILSAVNTVFPDNEAVGTYEYKGNTFNIYKDDIPLKIEDIAETDHDAYSYRLWNENESVFLKIYSAVQRPRMDALDNPDLSYTVTEVKMSALYDLCKRAALENFAKNYSHYQSDYEFRKEAVETDASKWGAESAYQLYVGGEKTDEFLVCFKDKIVAFDFDWEISEEQMKLCGEIFK